MDVPHARRHVGRLLAYATGLVNQKLLLQNEYLIAENRILRAHIPARLRLSNPERSNPLRSASASVAVPSGQVAIVAVGVNRCRTGNSKWLHNSKRPSRSALLPLDHFNRAPVHLGNTRRNCRERIM